MNFQTEERESERERDKRQKKEYYFGRKKKLESNVKKKSVNERIIRDLIKPVAFSE